ncbi:MAG: protein kinase [Armatimonadetes bacterium]|nr:protein kinase [Armatimonadota bacterium]
MLATGRSDRQSAGGREKKGRNGSQTGAGTRFDVLSRAGEGTLWIVYRVRERATGQTFALKALKNVFNRHPRFPGALLTVAERWSGLDHPHVAGWSDKGNEDDTLFVTTEWLPGGSLESRLNRAFSRDEIVAVLRAAASALEFLHTRGRTHGDLRARQLLFDASGRLKLTDGGLAEAFASSGLALADVQPDAAWYLAPERTQGAALAPPADLYALGVLLYRMLAGRVPFDGPSPLSIAQRHRTDAPLAPSQFNPRCPADLEQLALRLLEKDPALRPTAPELVQALQAMAPLTGALTPVTPAAAISVPTPVPTPLLPPESEPEPAIEVTVPRRRPLAPLVDEALAATGEEEIRLERTTMHRRHKRRELWGALGAFLWLLVVAGAFGGMFYGAYYFWLRQTPKTVRVPSYLGLEQNKAKERLAKAGLTMRVGRETFDATKPAGTVVKGEPEPGRLVRARREVTVTVSQGEAPIKMVDFTELPLAQARKIISQHAMRLGPVVEQFHDKVPRGYIAGQYPESGESFRRSEPITLIVSRGPQPTAIDATKGIGMPIDAPIAPVPEAVEPSTPFQPLPAAPANNGPATRVALIRVQIPAGSGTQPVQIIVRDADGERTAYSKTHRAGDQINERVRVRREAGGTALVRVYVGETMVKEEQL